MKATDYNDIITTLSNPDTAADGLVRLKEKLTADETEYNNLLKSNNDLRDTNSKLALKITSPVEVKEPEHVETNDEKFYRLFTSKFEEVK